MKPEHHAPSWKAGYMIETVEAQLKDRSAVLITYQGVKANVLNAFRATVASDKICGSCHVIQNTLIKKAAEKLGYKGLAEAELHGDTALVTGAEPVAIAKAVKEFAKENAQVKVKMGFVDGEVVDAQVMSELADIPSREVLLAQILGLLNAPASAVARAINAWAEAGCKRPDAAAANE